MVNKTSPLEKSRIQEQESLHTHHLWAYYSLIPIGFWLMTGFLPMGYESRAMIINDIVSGALLVFLGILSLKPTRYVAQWAAIVVGGWLCLAPLFLHAQTAAAYITDTLMGILVISFVLIIPNIPGIRKISYEGPDIPPGWSYNPSKWAERLPVVALGWLGFFTARYLAGYQMGYSDTIWDPFFNDGTKQILTSDVSESFPISDAGLGAFAYILDVLMGLVGKTARWRTMPWIVLIFGFLVIPLGMVSLTLVILQPLVVNAWCSACLLSALITVGMIPFTFDEVLASLQFMKRKKNDGQSYWKTFWFGGDLEVGRESNISQTGDQQIKSILNALWDDLKIKPWNLFVAIIIGLWIMLMPAILGFSGSLADSNYLTGALIITFSIISMSEIVRTGRFLNILCALWLIISTWVFGDAGTVVLIAEITAAILLIILSIRKGIIKDQHGGFNKYIK